MQQQLFLDMIMSQVRDRGGSKKMSYYLVLRVNWLDPYKNFSSNTWVTMSYIIFTHFEFQIQELFIIKVKYVAIIDNVFKHTYLLKSLNNSYFYQNLLTIFLSQFLANSNEKKQLFSFLLFVWECGKSCWIISK